MKQIAVHSTLDNRCLSAESRTAILREWQLAKLFAIQPNVMGPWGYSIDAEKCEVLAFPNELHIAAFSAKLFTNRHVGLLCCGQDGNFVERKVEATGVSSTRHSDQVSDRVVPGAINLAFTGALPGPLLARPTI